MKRRLGWLMMGILVVGSAGSAHADAVTECATAQAKALAGLFADITKEAARACGKGAAGAPLVVSQAKAGAALGKVYAKLGKAVDKQGQPSCAFNLATLDEVSAEPIDVLGAMQSLADRACLVPVAP